MRVWYGPDPRTARVDSVLAAGEITEDAPHGEEWPRWPERYWETALWLMIGAGMLTLLATWWPSREASEVAMSPVILLVMVALVVVGALGVVL